MAAVNTPSSCHPEDEPTYIDPIVPPSAHALEVADISRKYKDSCKVITHVGEFAYVIELRTQGLDLSVKFQIEDDYPAVIPNIIIKSRSISTPNKQDLIAHLTTQAERMKGGMMLDAIFCAAGAWVDENHISLLPCDPDTKTADKGKNKKCATKTKASRTPREAESVAAEKKPPMKTAEDVINRILWDDSLPVDKFTVGYLDRFLGVIEKAFMSFSWEDIASVDYNTLAIPKHRIQYFKYKEVKIWDKSERLDNVFGSLGSQTTITDVINSYDHEEDLQNTPDSTNGDSYRDGYDSDQSDDDVVIDTGCDVTEVTDDGHACAEAEQQATYPRDRYWGPRSRPTHFLALRVTNPSVVEAMREAHRKVLAIEPSYGEECLISVERLHVTLCCLGLDSEEDISKAARVLNSVKSELESLYTPPEIRLEFKDTDHFFNTTLYAKVSPSQELLDFAAHLRAVMMNAGVEKRDLFEFTPHMTIAKLKRQMGKDLRTPYLNPRIYEALDGLDLGSQTVDNVHLCSMSEDRQSDGFYMCPASVWFSQGES